MCNYLQKLTSVVSKPSFLGRLFGGGKINFPLLIYTLMFLRSEFSNQEVNDSIKTAISPNEQRTSIYSPLFLDAFSTVIKHEGNYSNAPGDPGGETNFGISSRSYPSLDIKNLTREQARKIYFKDYWIKGQYEKLKFDVIAIKLFDLGVNMGVETSLLLAGRALRAVRGGAGLGEEVSTESLIEKINACDPKEFISALRSEAAGYYRSIGNKKFLNGWLNRAYD
jgi:hypothetical protein